jgi:hypothetical protein
MTSVSQTGSSKALFDTLDELIRKEIGGQPQAKAKAKATKQATSKH